MHADFAESRLTHGRVWGLKDSAFYRTFNAMLANEAYVLFINGFICDDLASVALVVK